MRSIWKIAFSAMIAVVALASCKNSDAAYITIDDKYSITSIPMEGETLTFGVKSNVEWSVATTTAAACTVSYTADSVTVEVLENSTGETRPIYLKFTTSADKSLIEMWSRQQLGV